VALSLAIVAFLLGACRADPGGDERLQAQLAAVLDRYLEARNSVVTTFGGDGIDPSVPMTDAFRAELDCELAIISERSYDGYAYSTTDLTVEAFVLEGGEATLDVREHTKLAYQPGDGAPPFTEYGGDRRFGFVRGADGVWLLDSDDLIGEEGSLPETMVPAGSC